MIEDKLTPTQRLRLECLAQAVALRSMRGGITIEDIVKEAEVLEAYVAGSNESDGTLPTLSQSNFPQGKMPGEGVEWHFSPIGTGIQHSGPEEMCTHGLCKAARKVADGKELLEEFDREDR